MSNFEKKKIENLKNFFLRTRKDVEQKAYEENIVKKYGDKPMTYEELILLFENKYYLDTNIQNKNNFQILSRFLTKNIKEYLIKLISKYQNRVELTRYINNIRFFTEEIYNKTIDYINKYKKEIYIDINKNKITDFTSYITIKNNVINKNGYANQYIINNLCYEYLNGLIKTDYENNIYLFEEVENKVLTRNGRLFITEQIYTNLLHFIDENGITKISLIHQALSYDQRKYVTASVITDHKVDIIKNIQYPIYEIKQIKDSGKEGRNLEPKIIRQQQKEQMIGLVYIYIWFMVSQDVREKTIFFSSDGMNIDEIKERSYNITLDYFTNIDINKCKYEIAYSIRGDNKIITFSQEEYDYEQIKLMNTLLHNDYKHNYSKSLSQHGDFVHRINDMPLRNIKYIKLNYPIKSNNIIIGDNCVDVILNNIKKKHRIVKAVKNAITDRKKQNLDWTVETFTQFLKKNNIQYIAYTQDLKIYEKYEIKNNDKYKIELFIFSNEHIYNIDKNELKTLFINQSKCITDENGKIIRETSTLHDIIYMPYKKLNKYINDEIYLSPMVKHSFSSDRQYQGYKMINGDLKNTYETIFTSAIFLQNEKYVLYTCDELLLKSYKLTSKITPDFPISLGFKYFSSLEYICDKHALWSSCSHILDKPQALNYHNKNYNELNIDYLHTIDKNKCYSYVLKTLDYIPKINFDTQVLKYTGDDKQKSVYNFYHITNVVNQKNNFIETGWQSGYMIINNNLLNDVIIDNYCVPILVENPFKNIISEMLNNDPNIAKQIICRFLGNIQNYTSNNKEFIVPIRFTNNMLEAQQIVENNNNLSYTKIGDLYSIYKNVVGNDIIKKNMLPLSHYIHDYTKSMILCKIEEILKFDNTTKIVDIKTDSITIYNENITSHKFKKLLDLNEDNVDGWKYSQNCIDEDTNKIKDRTCKTDQCISNNKKLLNINTIEIENIVKYDYKNIRIHGDCAAGSGKSWFMINNIIENINKKSITDNKQYKILVLSGTHKALIDYRIIKNNPLIHIDINPIQTYILIPEKFRIAKNIKYDYILIDESGLLDTSHWDLVFQLVNYKNILISLGDTEQLYPVKLSYMPLKNMIIEELFTHTINMNENYRNHYLKNDYKNMQNLSYELTPYEKNIISTNETPYYSDYNICYYNKTVEHVNNTIVNYKTSTLQFEEINNIKVFKNCRYSIISNNLRHYDIYNNMLFKYISHDENNINLMLLDGDDRIFSITIEKFNKNNINYGYANTLHRYQGSSIDYNKMAIHDFDTICKNGRMLYTCLSRIKNNIIRNNENDTQNNINSQVIVDGKLTNILDGNINIDKRFLISFD